MPEVIIRAFKDSDLEGLWNIFHNVVQGGDTYDFSPDSTYEDALSFFTDPKSKCFVAECEGKIAGVYVFRANRRGLGSHIGNCSYMVNSDFRGRGIGEMLGSHSVEYARLQGYRGIQFNFVVSTNTKAVNLWKKIGFEIIGTIPEGYKHSKLGYVDAYIMFKKL